MSEDSQTLAGLACELRGGVFGGLVRALEAERRSFARWWPYGTSQKVDHLFAGEFQVTSRDGAAFRLAGLSFPTRFNLSPAMELPYNMRWFDVPPTAPYGQTPQLGDHSCKIVRFK